MLKWNKATPQPQLDDWTAHSGNGYFSVGPDTTGVKGSIWQYFSLSVGERSTRSSDNCREYWPREAISKMRAALDEIEDKLNGGTEPEDTAKLLRDVADVAREVGDIRMSAQDLADHITKPE